MFRVGNVYRLCLPDDWKRYPSEIPWDNKRVTLEKVITDFQEVSYDLVFGNDPGEFTHAVSCPGLTTKHIGNVFLAKPQWLKPWLPAKNLSFNTMGTRIGRIECRSPNLSNLPRPKLTEAHINQVDQYLAQKWDASSDAKVGFCNCEITLLMRSGCQCGGK